MKTVSVSELQKWRFCRRAWEFENEWEIEKPEKGIPLASGSAVHETIQARMQGKIEESEMSGYLYDSLFRILAPRNDTAEQVKKYGPGALRALAHVPEWVWGVDWKVEEKLQVVLEEDHWNFGVFNPEGVTLNFTPDLYALTTLWIDGVMGTPSEVTWLDIIDFKTGKKDALDHFLHDPQLIYYAVALCKIYKDLDPIPRITYIALPTEDSKKAVIQSEPWVLSSEQLKEAEEELVEGLRGIVEKARWANRNTHCGFCDFNRICSTRMLGGDWKGVIKDDYVKKEKRY